MSERKAYDVEIDRVFVMWDIPIVLTVRERGGEMMFICCIYKFNSRTGDMTHLALPFTEQRLERMLRGEVSVGDVFADGFPMYRIDNIMCVKAVARRTKMRFPLEHIKELDECYIRR